MPTTSTGRAAVVAIALIALFSASAKADWPARVFAPYMYLGAGDHFSLTNCDDACGQKFFTLAFVISNKQKNAAWDGRDAMDAKPFADQVDAIRKRGGDVIVSFGGAGGRELALVEEDPIALQAKYQAVVDAYHLTWLDFDIEGSALGKQNVNDRRNLALAAIQAKTPGLRISFTLPVDPDGISKSARGLLANAKEKGVKIYSVNVMTMDFGAHHSRGKRMSDVSIASAKKAHEQCQAIDADIRIGITPMIGQNDEKSEIFSTEDAKALVDWARDQPWVCSVSFWAINRDTDVKVTKSSNIGSGIEQKRWDFTKEFQKFTAAKQQ